MRNVLILIAAAFLATCSSPGPGQHLTGKGGRIYGGTLKANESDKYVTLFPHLIIDAISGAIANQVYDGLVRVNNKNISKILPGIAESWELDATGTVYTFSLKKGAVFHDDPCFPNGKGREVKASDFQYCFRLLCTSGANNAQFESSFKGKVKGADDFYERSKKGDPGNLEGVKVLNDYTLQVTLLSPASTFLYILASPAGYVFPKEAVEKYGDQATVGTGPFRINTIEEERVILVRHPSYFRTDSLGNVLPFLDSVVFNFIRDKSTELEAFKKEETHIIVGMPSASVSDMVEESIRDFNSKAPKYILYRNPEMSSEYYQFTLIKPPFDNLKVRKAFAYAIDRDKIISDVLHTEAFGPGICGLTPTGISGYDITSIMGYNFNPEKAKKLLAEAGYPAGKFFPRVMIELNSGGGKHINVVEEVKKQLKEVLNVEVDFTVVPFSQKLEDAKYSQTHIIRSGWVADYPNPESFLRMFYGAYVPESPDQPSYPNTTRYKNHAFDSLLEKGYAENDQEKSFDYYRQAEQIMMNDAPIMVLWYAENMKMAHSFVKNFYFNAMDYKDFSEVFLQKPSAPENP